MSNRWFIYSLYFINIFLSLVYVCLCIHIYIRFRCAPVGTRVFLAHPYPPGVRQGSWGPLLRLARPPNVRVYIQSLSLSHIHIHMLYMYRNIHTHKHSHTRTHKVSLTHNTHTHTDTHTQHTHTHSLSLTLSISSPLVSWREIMAGPG